MGNKMTTLLQSRRFYMAIAGVLTVFTDGFGLALTADQITGVIAILAGWIVSDGLKKTGE